MAHVSIHVRELLAAIRDDATSATLQPDDHARLKAIEESHDPKQTIALLHDYYGDLDRANRTPRAFLYLHLGWVIGFVERGDD